VENHTGSDRDEQIPGSTWPERILAVITIISWVGLWVILITGKTRWSDWQ